MKREITVENRTPRFFYGYIVILAAFGFSWGTLAVIRMPIVADVFGLSSLGAILGTLEFGAQIGAITGPLLAGWLLSVSY